MVSSQDASETACFVPVATARSSADLSGTKELVIVVIKSVAVMPDPW